MMHIDSGPRDSNIPGSSGDTNSNSSQMNMQGVSLRGSNAGQSPQIDSRKPVSPNHAQLSLEQQATNLYEELCEGLRKSRGMVDSMITEKNELLGEKRELENRLASTQEENVKLVEGKIKLEAEKAKLKARASKLESGRFQMEYDNFKLERIITKLEEENVKVENENAKLVKEKTKLADENTKLVKEKAKLVEDETNLAREKANLAAQISDHENTMRHLEQNMNEVRTELLSSIEKSEQFKNESMQKNNEIEKLKSENQEKERKLQDAKSLLDGCVKNSEEQVKMLNASLNKKDSQNAALKKANADLASQLKKEIELRGVENAAKEKAKNAVLSAFLSDEQFKLFTALSKLNGRQEEQQTPEGNVAAESPGTSGTAGQKRKAPEGSQDGPLGSNSKMSRQPPKKPGKGRQVLTKGYLS